MNKLIILSLLTLLLLFGCEKVIDVDLNEANPVVVIEGNLCLSKGAVDVKISKTGSYFGNEPLQNVTDANVFLEHHTGKRIAINETGPGEYNKKGILVQAGNEYKLFAEVEDVTYSAASTLNPPVEIDSLSYDYYDDVSFFETGYRAVLFFSDPPGKENYYRIKVYKNGSLQNKVNDLILFDDQGIEGRFVEVRLRGQVFNLGDTARIELISIDENVFDYFSILREMARTNPGSPAPANPVSNFSNDALGYFSAWSHDSQTIVIK
jgi:hypothetical protein